MAERKSFPSMHEVMNVPFTASSPKEEFELRTKVQPEIQRRLAVDSIVNSQMEKFVEMSNNTLGLARLLSLLDKSMLPMFIIRKLDDEGLLPKDSSRLAEVKRIMGNLGIKIPEREIALNELTLEAEKSQRKR
jgi:hypothetical protein